jgi:hypothetical protein
MWLGTIVLAGSVTAGLFYIAGKQKKGLHSKTQSRTILIHPANLKKLKFYGGKNRI